ncbi:GNAT family N-acetyltransferase [Limnobaculum parvum]|uniref:N-acetyltransferase n=1 Tax=Limnobaculum parvum TaxID=2172103 RepID=A0A2Y9TYY9_9GAMM|nr:GNAT family N-acetyltransferase [Limnobaculum parvum]AWH88937.1 N-acetyltransferase [Limnobaculum parvum]
MPKPIELDTQRLRLRQWQPKDRAPFAELNADPEVMKYFPTTLDRATSDAMADRCQSLIAERGWGLWAVELKSDGQFIGFVGLNIPTNELPFSPCVEISWRLANAFWGQGYATEAAKHVLQVGFEQLELPEIVAFTTIANQRSRAVMEKLGMTRTPDDFEHPALAEGHPLRKHCLYRIASKP